jgi:D-glycero-D-manno-heptose 1,7-bisphosphate phosphatase
VGEPADIPGADGFWREVFAHAHRGGSALFLDRDGVIVEDVNYLQRVEDIQIIPGAAEVIAVANRLAIPVAVVTNQAGIGRGYFGWPEFAIVQAAILAALAREGARVDAVYACAHHRDGPGVYAHPDHPARKPNPGILLRAAADLDIDLKRSWLVGDNITDIEAARRAGLAGALHVATGHGERHRAGVSQLAAPDFEVRTGHSIAEALALPLPAR